MVSSKSVSTVLSVVIIMSLLLVGPGAFAEEKTKIVMWTLGDAYYDLIDRIMPDFEEAFPHVELEVVFETHDSDQLVVEYAAGTAPDIATQWTAVAPAFIEAGVFVPLDFKQFDAVDAHDFVSRYWPGMKRILEYKGTIYNVPLEVSTVGLFYNESLLHAAGVQEPPTTWEGLNELGARLVRGPLSGREGATGMFFPRSYDWMTIIWGGFIRQNGIDWLDENGDPNFSDPAAIGAIEAYADFYLSGASHPYTDWEAFWGGNAAYTIDGAYAYVYYKDGAAGFDAGTAQFPTLENGVPNVPTYAWGLYVTSQSENPELAWQVANFFSQEKYSRDWFYIGGLLQPYRSPWLNDVIADEPLLAPFVTSLEHAQMEIAHPNYYEIAGAMMEAETAIATQQSSVSEALINLNTVLGALVSK